MLRRADWTPFFASDTLISSDYISPVVASLDADFGCAIQRDRGTRDWNLMKICHVYVTSFLILRWPPPLGAALLCLCAFCCCWMQRVLTFISSVTSHVRMAALTGQLAVILIDTIAVLPASGIPHAVRKKGTLLCGAPLDLGMAATATVQTFVADGLSAGEMLH